MNIYYVAAIWLGMALLASVVSIRIAVPAALVTVVILSAFVPTLIAQQLSQPKVLDTEEEEALGEEDLSIIHHRLAPTEEAPGTSGPA